MCTKPHSLTNTENTDAVRTFAADVVVDSGDLGRLTNGVEIMTIGGLSGLGLGHALIAPHLAVKSTLEGLQSELDATLGAYAEAIRG
jgi:hypothetical protein